MPERDRPCIPKCGPYTMEMEPGTYLWCACGRSQTQPFCDGSHHGTEFSPIEVVFEASRRYGWCGCKHSGKISLCDGTHKRLAAPEISAPPRQPDEPQCTED